jgi:hypothetical protein
MYYSYVEIEYVATSLSPARTDLAVKLLNLLLSGIIRLLDIQEARDLMDNYDKDTIIEIYIKWLTTSTVTFARDVN